MMRPRQREGVGGVRGRSQHQPKGRDHHRDDWRASPPRRSRFSPPLELERHSRRQSVSIERRDFGTRRYDGGRDDGGGFVRSRPLDDSSLPPRLSPHGEYRRSYFDVDIEANLNSKYGGDGSGISRAAKNEGFHTEPTTFGKYSEDGMRQSTLFAQPPERGYSNVAFGLSKISGSSAFSSTTSLGVSLNASSHGDEAIRFRDGLSSNKIPSEVPYQEERQSTLYSGNGAYPTMPAMSAPQLKDFGNTSSGFARDEFFSSYQDTLILQAESMHNRIAGGKFSNPVEHVRYEQRYFDPENVPEVDPRDGKLYWQSLLSPGRDKPLDHGLGFDQRDRPGLSFFSDKLKRKMQSNAGGEYSSMDSMGPTFTGSIGDRIDGVGSSHGRVGDRIDGMGSLHGCVGDKIDGIGSSQGLVGDRIDHIGSSYRMPRETNARLWDRPILSGEAITDSHDVNRGLPLSMDRHGEHYGSGHSHLEFLTKGARGHDVILSDDYGFRRDAMPVDYRERLSSPLQDRGPDLYRLEMSFGKRSNGEDLEVYSPERAAKGKYAVDEIIGHESGVLLINSRSSSRHFQHTGNGDYDRRSGQKQGGIVSSKQLGFRHESNKNPLKSFGCSQRVDRPGSWLPSKFFPSRKQAVAGRGASLKRRLKPGPSDLSLRHSIVRSRKFWKGPLDDRQIDANVQDVNEVEVSAPSVKTDPPEGSEEFKQMVQRAFLRFSKQLNENLAQQRKYKEQGRAGSMHCSVCGSSSKEFSDTHSLVGHALNSPKVGLRTDHLGLHKALCVMMGWSSLTDPDNGRAYQSMPAEEASALKEDLILWPPLVIIHNSPIRNKEAKEQVIVTKERLEEMLKEMGFGAGIKVTCGKPANHSILVVKFMPTFSGLQQAEKLHKYFTEKRKGRKELQFSSGNSKGSHEGGDLQAENMVELLLFGYMGIAEDLYKLDFEMKKRCVVKSMKEIEAIADASLNTD